MPKKRTTEIDEKLLLIQHLYGEGDSSEILDEILEDPKNQEKFKRLLHVKQQMESPSLRRSIAVPEQTLSQIFIAARSKSPRLWSGMVRRPRPLILIGGVGAVTACLLFIFLLPTEQPESPILEDPQTSSSVELQWDDTRDRVVMQQALSVVRQRTSPDLWDESEVMKLDSLPDISNAARPGVEAVSVPLNND